MGFSFLNEQSLGELPKPFSISEIINLTKNSESFIEVFDTDPNLVALLDSSDGKIVLKRFGWRNRLHFYTSPFKHSRARMSWESAILLDSIGITPKPLFVYTKNKCGFKYENFFITEAIEPHINLRKFLKIEKNKNTIKIVLQKLATVISNMHQLGIFHRDLTTGNFLIDENNHIYIVDLNRARKFERLSNHKRLKDLRKIYFEKESEISQDNMIEIFFQQYKKDSGIDIDWVNRYWKYRKKLIARRKRKKLIKSINK